jgi:hypothetical protein
MGNKKWKQLSTTLGNLFMDLGKLIFGSLILGSVLKGGVDPFQTFIFGAGLAMIAFAVGVWFIIKSEV